MRFICAIVLFFSVLFFNFSCTQQVCEGQVKSLDSLSGALNQKLAEFKQVDTAILAKAIGKFNNYRQFIKQNVNDTVNKAEADFLQQFYSSGQNLVYFSDNRKNILARGSLINSQIGKLTKDVNSSAIDREKFSQFYVQEKSNAEQLIKLSVNQQQLFLGSLQEFRLSLAGIENLIRSRNNGQMPTVIKDSIPL
jgi:hypothetical protein